MLQTPIDVCLHDCGDYSTIGHSMRVEAYMGVRGEVFSSRASSGNRTYFFNVKENRTGDLFLNIVESKKQGETGFERHQIVVFQEDLVEFLSEFQKATEFMKGSARRVSNEDRRGAVRRKVRIRRRPREDEDQA